jgi:hypothetical protein
VSADLVQSLGKEPSAAEDAGGADRASRWTGRVSGKELGSLGDRRWS